jgi:hypothetical protein
MKPGQGIWAGATGIWDAPFSVFPDGTCYVSYLIYEYTGVSDTIILSHNISASTNNTNYEKVKTIILGSNVRDGRTLRIKFTLASETGSYAVYGRIYRNGVAVGTIRTTTSMGGEDFSEDIAGWQLSDNIELWLRTSNALEAVYGSELKVCGNIAAPQSEITGTNYTP